MEVVGGMSFHTVGVSDTMAEMGPKDGQGPLVASDPLTFPVFRS